jgi:hypothetical protein
MKLYEQLRVEHFEPDLGDLEFWKRFGDRMPHMFHVFCSVRSARPATAQLEGFFSVAEAAVPKQRQSMHVSTLNDILAVKCFNVTPALVSSVANIINGNSVDASNSNLADDESDESESDTK